MSTGNPPIAPTLGLLLAGCVGSGSPVADMAAPASPALSAPSVPWQHAPLSPSEPGPEDSAVDAGPPIVVVVLADDLGSTVYTSMETVEERLAPESVRFTRAYSSVPLCCPVRASFLSGGWSPSVTGVHSNDVPNGGFGRFSDADTLATRLQGAGFATALLGKYLNGYDAEEAPYVPPGWDLFLATTDLGDSTNATFVRGASSPDAAGEGEIVGTDGVHATPWIFDEALAFLDGHPDEPAFILLTPQSPHPEGDPEASDVGTRELPEHAPSYAEADVSDKPAWIQAQSDDEAGRALWDATLVHMLENAASLDRAVGALYDGLEARGLLDRTTLVFTGDNGYLHGEHRLEGKGQPYEESVRVPLLVRAPGVEPRDDARLVAMNLDLAATVAEIAGLEPWGEGVGLSAALLDPTSELRDHVPLETSEGAYAVWRGVVTDRWKYVEWGTGETELYDLDTDPYELESLAAHPPEEADVAAMAAWVDDGRPLVVTTLSVEDGYKLEEYDVALGAWGGTPPLTWTLEAGTLPPGLSLSAEGELSGEPRVEGSYAVWVRVTDSGASPVTGEPATFLRSLVLTVLEDDEPGHSDDDDEDDDEDEDEDDGGGWATASREGSADAPGVWFDVGARPGSRVSVRAHADATRDTPPLRSEQVLAGADGRAHVRMELDPARTWYWDAQIDGVTVRGGILRAR